VTGDFDRMGDYQQIDTDNSKIYVEWTHPNPQHTAAVPMTASRSLPSGVEDKPTGNPWANRNLEFVLSPSRPNPVMNGAELAWGIAEYAREHFGYMARDVLEHWKIRNTLDYGEIVYLLIKEGIMSKTDGDRKEDFADVYDFDTEFTWERSKPDSFPERF
jgi:uncharacterized repeat protein (TIGR04138 family)